MLDFREEISKYKPILEIDDIESSIESDDSKDLMDAFTHLIKQIVALRPGRFE